MADVRDFGPEAKRIAELRGGLIQLTLSFECAGAIGVALPPTRVTRNLCARPGDRCVKDRLGFFSASQKPQEFGEAGLMTVMFRIHPRDEILGNSVDLG